MTDTFAGRVRRARKAAGWSQAKLAAEAGLSSGTISVWERGAEEEPNRSSVLAVARALQISSDWLLEGGPEPTMVREPSEGYAGASFALKASGTVTVGDSPDARLATLQGAVAKMESALVELRLLRDRLVADLTSGPTATEVEQTIRDVEEAQRKAGRGRRRRPRAG